MRVVVLGCGRVGARLAGRLENEGYEVAVIDKNETSFELLGRSFKGLTVKGVGFDRAVLKKAGISRADAFIAVTSGDNTNIIAGMVAKEEFNVPKVICRIFDPRRAEVYQKLGILTVSPVAWVTNRLVELLTGIELVCEPAFGRGQVDIEERRIPGRLVGQKVEEIAFPGEIQVISIVRDEKAFIPLGEEMLQEGDIIQVASLISAKSKLKKLFYS